MKKTRIVKFQTPSYPYYEIQEKHWLFGWRPAGSGDWNFYENRFCTLAEAKANVKWFDGSVPDYEVME